MLKRRVLATRAANVATIFICMLQATLLTVKDILRQVQKHLQNKMAIPEASVHPVKNRLWYHFMANHGSGPPASHDLLCLCLQHWGGPAAKV